MTVWMKHPLLPETQLIQVPDEALQGHLRMGWQVTDPPPPPEIETESADVEPGTGAVAVGEAASLDNENGNGKE